MYLYEVEMQKDLIVILTVIRPRIDLANYKSKER